MTTIQLHRINATTYTVVNTPLIIRRVDPQFSGQPAATWDLASTSGAMIESELATLAQARYQAGKFITETLQAEINAWDQA